MAKLQAIKFKEVTRVSTFQIMPDIPFAFEDPDAVPFFMAAFGAEKTSEEPAYTFTQDEISVDPLTKIAETGKYVLPDKAEAALSEQEKTDG